MTVPTDGELLPLGPCTVVVAGDDAGPAARLLAEAADWPLLAEPTSGARIGRQALRTGRLLLTTALRGDVERVVVVGHPTLSRPVTSLISDPDLEVLAVRGRDGIATDPGRVARVLEVVPRIEEPRRLSVVRRVARGRRPTLGAHRRRLSGSDPRATAGGPPVGTAASPLSVAAVVARAVAARARRWS